MSSKDFCSHPVLKENFFESKYLEKILTRLCERRLKSYEEILSIECVGPKTIMALSLVLEIIYGTKPSYQDPTRYAFAYGGKNKVPYPVDKETYDEVINFFKKYLTKLNKKHLF